MVNRQSVIKFFRTFAVASYILIPFIITQNGNNLIRFDIPKLELYFFNTIITFNNFFNASLLLIISVFLFIIATQIFGRIWCGWLCPQEIGNDFIDVIASKLRSKSSRFIAKILVSFFISFMFATSTFFYFVSPYDLSQFLQSSGVVIGGLIWFFFFLFLFLDYAFVGHKWCKYLCPYSKMLGVMTDNDTLYVGMLKGEDDNCIKCLACVKTCPMKIDPRKTPDNDCIYCEECIKACDKVLKRKGGKSILGYVWGVNDTFTLKRVNLLITIAITCMLILFLLYNVVKNDVISVEQLNYNGANSTYTVELENKSALSMGVKINAVDSNVTLEPDYVFINRLEKIELDIKVIGTTSDNVVIEFVGDETYRSKIELKNK